MRISLRLHFLIVAIFGIVFAISSRLQMINTLEQRWTEIGGTVGKDVFPIFGWGYVCLGRTSKKPAPRSVEEVNKLILEITNQPACNHFRLEKTFVESLQIEDSSEIEILNRVLSGVSVQKIELIDWEIELAELQSKGRGMRTKRWDLRYSSAFGRKHANP